jgi:anhydro-N-acetylmuramic acid kinase
MPINRPVKRFYIGLMSGTSVDAIDAVLVRFDGHQPEIIATHTHPMLASTPQSIVRLSQQQQVDMDELGALDSHLGDCFAEAVLALLDKAGVPANQVEAIASHGQTIRHRPEGNWPFTWQIGNPALLAARSGIDVIADFRRADVAVGGQGAPLVPAFHQQLYRSDDENRVVVNIGGMANITCLPRDATVAVSGFDTGPGNVLLNFWIHHHQQLEFDKDAHWARQYAHDEVLLQRLLADDYFHRPAPKSTGREYFHEHWLAHCLADCPGLAAGVVQATLTHLTAVTISQAIRQVMADCQRVLVCGGGAHNPLLMRLLDERLPQVSSTADFPAAEQGLDADFIEALAFAWMAKQYRLGSPANLPAVTGARRAVVLGACYPATA